MSSKKHNRGRELVHGEVVATAGHSREFVLPPRRGSRAAEGRLPAGVKRRWYFGKGGCLRVGLVRDGG